MARKKRKISEPEAAEAATSKRTKSSSSTTRTTRSMTCDAPRQAVLTTTELLEAIIVCLPPKNIFTIQRVSRRFRNCISSSTQIQQKLFVKPWVEKESWLLRTLQPVVYPRRSNWNQYEFVQAAANVTNVVSSKTVFPAMVSSHLQPYFAPNAAMRAGVFGAEWFSFDMSSLINRPGSWHAIKITDPPCATARIGLRARTEDISATFYSEEYIDLTCISGITLGDVSNALMNQKHTMRFHQREPKAKRIVSGARSCTMDDLISELSRSARGHVPSVNYLRIDLMTPDVVLPTDQEREQVRQKVQDREME